MIAVCNLTRCPENNGIFTIRIFVATATKASRIMLVPAPQHNPIATLPIAFGHTFQFVLLLDRVRVAASLGSVDQLFGKTLGNALDVSESGLAGTDGKKGNGLVDTAERGDIDGLSSDGTGASNSGAVFARTAVDNGVDGDLDRVLVCHDVDLG